MNAAQLIKELQKVDPGTTVRYKYDGGHSYPTFVRAYLTKQHVAPDSALTSEFSTDQEFICLDESED